MDKSNSLIKKIKNQLNDFAQLKIDSPATNVGYEHNLSGNYEVLRMIRFIFSEILNFEIYDQPFEKINWYIPFVYQNSYNCSVSHRKFGFKLSISCTNKEEGKQLSVQIEAKLHQSLNAIAPLIDEYAREALQNGEIIIENHFNQLRGAYDFFRKKTIASEKLIQEAFSDKRAVSRRQIYHRAIFEKEYFEQAAYFSFFSMLEHICVLFLGFTKTPDRENVVEFSRLRWSDKFKIIFDVKEPIFKNAYDNLINLARYKRNPAAHGHTNTVFSFYLKGARHKIPVTITDENITVQLRNPINNFDILDSFLKLIMTSRLTKNIFYYIGFDLNVSFDKKSFTENDLITKMSDKELFEYVDYTIKMYDNMANMDW